MQFRHASLFFRIVKPREMTQMPFIIFENYKPIFRVFFSLDIFQLFRSFFFHLMGDSKVEMVFRFLSSKFFLFLFFIFIFIFRFLSSFSKYFFLLFEMLYLKKNWSSKDTQMSMKVSLFSGLLLGLRYLFFFLLGLE